MPEPYNDLHGGAAAAYQDRGEQSFFNRGSNESIGHHTGTSGSYQHVVDGEDFPRTKRARPEDHVQEEHNGGEDALNDAGHHFGRTLNSGGNGGSHFDSFSPIPLDDAFHGREPSFGNSDDNSDSMDTTVGSDGDFAAHQAGVAQVVPPPPPLVMLKTGGRRSKHPATRDWQQVKGKNRTNPKEEYILKLSEKVLPTTGKAVREHMFVVEETEENSRFYDDGSTTYSLNNVTCRMANAFALVSDLAGRSTLNEEAENTVKCMTAIRKLLPHIGRLSPPDAARVNAPPAPDVLAVALNATTEQPSLTLQARVKRCETSDDIDAIYNGKLFQMSLQRIDKAQEGLNIEDLQDWAREWALSRGNIEHEDYDAAFQLDDDRRACLELLKQMDVLRERRSISNTDLIGWKHRVERILSLCLVMDRAQALYTMKRNEHVGMHWYAERHEESADFRKWNKPTLSRHYMFLFEMEELELEDNDLLVRMFQPHPRLTRD